MAEEPVPAAPPPSPGDDFYARDRAFWLTMGRAAIIGLIAGAGALAFTQLVRIGTNLLWPDDQTTGWFSGSWWWVLVLTGAGILVGVLRIATRIPEDLDGSLTIVQSASVDRRTALPAIGISLVSLIGGASLGPFDGGTGVRGPSGSRSVVEARYPDRRSPCSRIFVYSLSMIPTNQTCAAPATSPSS